MRIRLTQIRDLAKLVILWLITFIICQILWQNVIVYKMSDASYAYVFYANSDYYACSALVNAHMLQQVLNTPHRIFIIISDNVSPTVQDALALNNVTIIKETPLPLHADSISYYQGCLLKLAAFKFYEFDPTISRLLVLDADQLIIQSLDRVFELQTTDVMAPTAYWIDNHTISSTCMLIQPSPSLWRRVLSAAETIASNKYDMDLLNDLFAERKHRLSGRYVTLNSHWEDWNGPSWMDSGTSDRKNVDRTVASDKELRALYDQAAVVHFTAAGKPWMHDTEQLLRLRPGAHPVMAEQWIRWRSLALQICPAGIVSHI